MDSDSKEINVRKHLVGVLLLLFALSTLGLMTLLPSSSKADIDLPFLNTTQKSLVLAFAGFPGCSTTCPISLNVLGDVYRNFNSEGNGMKMGITFINIKLDTPHDITDSYAKSYHREFSSYSVNSKEAYGIYKALSLQTFKNAKDSTHHTGYIYMFVKELDRWRIQHVYRQIPSSVEIISDLNKLKLSA